MSLLPNSNIPMTSKQSIQTVVTVGVCIIVTLFTVYPGQHREEQHNWNRKITFVSWLHFSCSCSRLNNNSSRVERNTSLEYLMASCRSEVKVGGWYRFRRLHSGTDPSTQVFKEKIPYFKGVPVRHKTRGSCFVWFAKAGLRLQDAIKIILPEGAWMHQLVSSHGDTHVNLTEWWRETEGVTSLGEKMVDNSSVLANVSYKG